MDKFCTGIPCKKFSGRFKYLDSLEKFVVVVALADGCSFPEVHRTFHFMRAPQWIRTCNIYTAVEWANQPLNISIMISVSRAGALSQAFGQKRSGLYVSSLGLGIIESPFLDSSSAHFYFVLEILCMWCCLFFVVVSVCKLATLYD